METKGVGVQGVVERFPQHWGRVRRLLEENDDFRELCQDYDDCVKALLHWRNSRAPDAQRWVDEFRTLRAELEAEILRFLEPSDRRDHG